MVEPDREIGPVSLWDSEECHRTKGRSSLGAGEVISPEESGLPLVLPFLKSVLSGWRVSSLMGAGDIGD